MNQIQSRRDFLAGLAGLGASKEDVSWRDSPAGGSNVFSEKESKLRPSTKASQS